MPHSIWYNNKSHAHEVEPQKFPVIAMRPGGRVLRDLVPPLEIEERGEYTVVRFPLHAMHIQASQDEGRSPGNSSITKVTPELGQIEVLPRERAHIQCVSGFRIEVSSDSKNGRAPSVLHMQIRYKGKDTR